MTLRDLMESVFERHADRTAIRVLRGSETRGGGGLEYSPITYGQLREQRNSLASGLSRLGLDKGQRVGVLTDGGLEPILVFLAADLLGLSSVPLCNKLPDDILVHNINHSGIVLLLADPRSHEQVQRIYSRLTAPPRLVLTEGHPEGTESFFDLLQSGKGVRPPDVEIGPDDESKILYTSGSSGFPKGVVQTHRNLVDNVKSVADVISHRDPAVIFKSPPDYHTLGVLNIYFPLSKGWVLDLPRSPERVLADIRRSEPHIFLTVPLVLDKVYGNVRKEIDAGGSRGWLIARAVSAKQRISRGGASLADRLVYLSVGRKVVSQIRERLHARVGSRLELLIVGAAKADPEALDFFQDVLGITAFEGYGVTECAPLIAANLLTGQRVGTVGRPLLKVKLVTEGGDEVGHGDPESGEYRSSGGEAGELWVHGTHVMTGYLDDPERTAEALVRDEEGKVWYRTGDLFSIDEDGYLTFRGRLGRQFKLRNGEFVNPEMLERVYSGIPLLEHVLVVGDQSRDYPLPVVVVNLEEARAIPDIPDLPANDDTAVRSHPAIQDRVRTLMLQEATRAGLPGHERPQRVLVLPEAFSEEAGTLTRGLRKLVPKQIQSAFKEQIEEAYAAK